MISYLTPFAFAALAAMFTVVSLAGGQSALARRDQRPRRAACPSTTGSEQLAGHAGGRHGRHRWLQVPAGAATDAGVPWRNDGPGDMSTSGTTPQRSTGGGGVRRIATPPRPRPRRSKVDTRFGPPRRTDHARCRSLLTRSAGDGI